LFCHAFTPSAHNYQEEWKNPKAFNPGANRTNVSYHSSAVKINNATSSLVRFESKTIFVYFEKTL
jgi:hypothetical protein